MPERGAIAWKVLVAFAATAGGVWVATQLSSPTPSGERAAEVAGGTAPPRIVQTGRPGGAPPAPAPAPATLQSDPFAGVDVSTNSVLRHIAGIEEKARAKLAAAKRTAPATPPAEPANTDQVAAPPASRQEASENPNTRSTPAAAVPASSPPTVPADGSRPAVAPTQAQPAAEPEPAPSDVPPPAPLKSPAMAPVNSAPSVAGDRTLAAARVEPPTPAVAPPLRIVERTVPEFPGEAIRAGVRSGRVVARLTIDADGRVTGTRLLSATPSGFFERESRRALSTWRYEAPGRETTADVELVFDRE